jgi:hypothetical protein
MVAAYEPDSNYVIQVTDPADPKKVIGYAFVEQLRYLAVDDRSDEGKTVLQGIDALFGPGGRIRKLKAVTLPGQKRASREFYAEMGSGGPR